MTLMGTKSMTAPINPKAVVVSRELNHEEVYRRFREAHPHGKEVVLSAPQMKFVETKALFPAFVAGFGSGKTQALIARCIAYKLKYPKLNSAYYLPTFDLVKKIGFPRFEEELTRLGIVYVLNKTDAVIHVLDMGSIIFRTMDTPARIIGYEVADSFVDELDTLKMEDAQEVWRKILSRNRQKKPDGARNTVAVGTTPEGFRFVYDRWRKNRPNLHYKLIRASTYSNEHNLPLGYIDQLRADYPAHLVEAYINGRFVNLTSGAVYPEFSRLLNGSSEEVTGSEPLHIGMDFNVGKMAAVVFVLRKGLPCAVDEFVGILDTPTMIAAIREKFGRRHTIYVYPDASGGSRKTNDASVSDLSLLSKAGFIVLANPSNPAVRDRVLAVNQLINTPTKGRRLGVNVDKCPSFTECLEKQAYNDKGEPDKKAGFDHAADAGGYFIAFKFPVVGRTMQHVSLTGN